MNNLNFNGFFEAVEKADAKAVNDNEALAKKLVGETIFFKLRGQIEFLKGYVFKSHGVILEINVGCDIKSTYYSINDMMEIQIKK